MVIGDKKQAIALGAVAMAILSVGAFEIIPKGAKPQPAEQIRAADAVAVAHQSKVNEELPTAITSSPFSKPEPPAGPTAKPISKQTPQAGSGPANDASMTGNIPENPGSSSYTIPTFKPQILPLSPGKGTAILADPGENAGISQLPIEKKERTATLDAVLNVERWTAIVTLSGQEKPMQCEIGETVGGALILGINQSSMTLLVGKHLVVVYVGSTVNL